MDKEITVYSHKGLLFSNNKKRTTSTCDNTDKSQEYYVDQKKLEKFEKNLDKKRINMVPYVKFGM